MLLQLCQSKHFAISREQTWVAWKFILSLRKSCKLYYAQALITNFKIESWIPALCTFRQHSLIVRREKSTFSQKSISMKETLLSSLLPFHTKIRVESLFERCQKKCIFSFPEQLNRWPCHSLTESLSDFWLWNIRQAIGWNLWPATAQCVHWKVG